MPQITDMIKLDKQTLNIIIAIFYKMFPLYFVADLDFLLDPCV